MSKHAILITAYKDVESVIELIDTMGSRFNFYIHFDKKRDLKVDRLKALNNVFYWQRYKVNWGGVNHLHAILFLVENALLNQDNSFFHLITAEDFPIKSAEEILKIDTNKSYLKSRPFPFYGWDNSGGHDRYRRYQFYDVFNAKMKFGARFIHLLLIAQKKLGIFRKPLFDFPMFGGSTYWSLNREILVYVMEKVNDRLRRGLAMTFCAEEFVFQTILENSKYKDTIMDDNLRYIDWSSKRGGDPAFLDESDFSALLISNALFARKIRKNGDDKLLKILKEKIYNSQALEK